VRGCWWRRDAAGDFDRDGDGYFRVVDPEYDVYFDGELDDVIFWWAGLPGINPRPTDEAGGIFIGFIS
jgi:hypothetical protein